jgi:hypothetical protein
LTVQRVEYSAWSHQVIGEATLKRVDYPSAEAVDAAIAKTEAEWEKQRARNYPSTDPTITTTPAPTVTQGVIAKDPDLSGASEDQIKRAAQEDGILWYKTHPRTKVPWTDILSIGKGHALRRHLLRIGYRYLCFRVLANR